MVRAADMPQVATHYLEPGQTMVASILPTYIVHREKSTELMVQFQSRQGLLVTSLFTLVTFPCFLFHDEMTNSASLADVTHYRKP